MLPVDKQHEFGMKNAIDVFLRLRVEQTNYELLLGFCRKLEDSLLTNRRTGEERKIYDHTWREGKPDFVVKRELVGDQPEIFMPVSYLTHPYDEQWRFGVAQHSYKNIDGVAGRYAELPCSGEFTLAKNRSTTPEPCLRLALKPCDDDAPVKRTGCDWGLSIVLAYDPEGCIDWHEDCETLKKRHGDDVGVPEYGAN